MKFILPLPPCINQTYGVSRSGGQSMFKKRPVKNWEFVAGWEVKRQWRGKPLEGPVSLEIHWYYKNDRDIDAGLKVLLDLFEKQSVYLNDGQVRRITNMTIEEDKKNPRVEVEIEIMDDMHDDGVIGLPKLQCSICGGWFLQPVDHDCKKKNEIK